MPGFDKGATAVRCWGFGETKPIAPLLVEPISAESPQQDVIRTCVFGVQLEAIAFEALDRKGLAVDCRLLLWADGIAKHRQATVLIPKLGDPTVHALIGLDKTPLGC